MSRQERVLRRPCCWTAATFATAVMLMVAFACGTATVVARALRAAAEKNHRRCDLAEARAAQAESLVISLARSVDKAAGRPVRVALFRDEASCDPPEELDGLRAGLGSTWIWEQVSPADVRTGALEPFDVVVFPGGRGSRQLAALGGDGKRAVRDYVERGGGYVGICGGAFLATHRYLGLVDIDVLTGDRTIPGVGRVSLMARGPATVRMELTPAGLRALDGPLGGVPVEFAGGPIFLNAEGDDHPSVPLARYRTEVWNYDCQRGTMLGSPSILAARRGRGKVIIFSPHPERTAGLGPLLRRAILAAAREP